MAAKSKTELEAELKKFDENHSDMIGESGIPTHKGPLAVHHNQRLKLLGQILSEAKHENSGISEATEAFRAQKEYNEKTLPALEAERKIRSDEYKAQDEERMRAAAAEANRQLQISRSLEAAEHAKNRQMKVDDDAKAAADKKGGRRKYTTRIRRRGNKCRTNKCRTNKCRTNKCRTNKCKHHV
jgi:hypothetical protein